VLFRFFLLNNYLPFVFGTGGNVSMFQSPIAIGVNVSMIQCLNAKMLQCGRASINLSVPYTQFPGMVKTSAKVRE
jgi:hypothetical protein